MITGTCLCRKVKFEIEGGIIDASQCHCSICRKATGSAFGAYGGVQIDNLKWTQGKDQLNEFNVTDVLKKYFCKNCGSTLASHHQSWPEFIYISLGCVEGNPQVDIEYHQFVASSANWETICDGIKQYNEWPDESE